VRFALCLAVLLAACQDNQPKLKLRDEACVKNRDCSYGLDCADAVAPADGGVLAKPGKTCQFHSFAECEGDGTQAAPDGQPQCLNSYKCREGHCTVQCAGHQDCKQDEVCKVGLCLKGSGNAKAQCFDNRDCPYPESCSYGQCVTRAVQRCNTDLECPPDLRCLNALCQ
jgi:hypothetical protein